MLVCVLILRGNPMADNELGRGDLQDKSEENLDTKLYAFRHDIREEFRSIMNHFTSEIREQYDKDRQAFDAKIKRYIKYGLLILGFLGVTSAGGLWGIFKWVSHEVRQALDADINNVHKEVSKRLDTEFESKKIQSLIEDTARKYTVGDVQRYISDRVDKAVVPVQQSLDQKLQESSKLVADLSLAREFTLTIIAAQSDDWSAFHKLEGWSNDKSFPFQEMAAKATVRIRSSYVGFISEPYLEIPWNKDTDPKKLSLDELKSIYASLDPLFHAALVHTVWQRSDIPKKERMEFLMNVLETSNSLTAKDYAGKFFVEGTGDKNLKWSPFVTTPILSWWTENKETIQSTSFPGPGSEKRE